jgi:MFS family permease
LALQNSYAALVVLRCLQSSGSSGTVALGAAVVTNLVTRAERGKYIGYASMGVTLGPSLGPVIGGLLNHFLGWRSIFWFFTIFAGTMMLLMIRFFPETSRSVVGNGSVPPQKWNVSVMRMIRQRRSLNGTPAENHTIARRKRRPNPFEAVKIAFEKEAGMILFIGAIIYAGYFSILSSLPSQLHEKYGFNSLQIGLCYLPYGIGSMSSRWTVGTMVDWNFRRHARRLGIEIIKNRQQSLSDFPVEVARLQITLPLIYASCISIIIYSWVMEYHTNLAEPLISLFLSGHTASGAFRSLSTLVVDINVESPATAVAANNLFRCLFGAGAVAAIVPIINRIGMGWTGTIIAFIWLTVSPILWAVMKWGHGWREEKRVKEKAATNNTEGKESSADPEKATLKNPSQREEEGRNISNEKTSLDQRTCKLG